VLFSRRAEQHVFYMPSNAGFALYFNLLAIAAARIRGYRCVLHHHIYIYLNRYDWRMKLLDRLLGVEGLHVVLCPHMEQQLRSRYNCRAAVAIVPSAIQLLQSSFAAAVPTALPDAPPKRFCLGHLGNLSMAKGLDLAIDTLRALRRNNRDVKLVLAGPVQSKREAHLIEEAKQEFADRFEYRGPVYGDEKRRFFEEIDAVLFPTRYPDAQPLVITETFGFGRPVLYYGRGCIPGMMGSKTDWSIAVTDDFVARAVPLIEAWIDDPQGFPDACRFARRRYDDLLTEANRAFEDFVLWVRGESPPGFAHRGPRSN
jgi:glycosyltransferase involved in cell wall biosynthesis